MSINLLHDLCYSHLLQVELHLLSILYTLLDQFIYAPVANGHDVLNFTSSVAGSLLARGSILDSILIPSARALGGINVRNRRADFDRGEKGLKLTRTSVKNRVNIFCGKRKADGPYVRIVVETLIKVSTTERLLFYTWNTYTKLICRH